MASVSQLGYLGFQASNLDAWENFATQILGIESVGRNENGALMFRIDEYQYRFVFEQGNKDDLDLIGWQVDDERSLDAIADHVGHPREIKPSLREFEALLAAEGKLNA